MKYLKTISLLLILLPIPLISQSDFQPGYYITHADDTIYGLIDYRSESKSFQICKYKADESSRTLELFPDDIKGYKYSEGKYYISKEIETKGGKSRVFVEYLLNGITDLYFYNDNENNLYIIETKEGELYNLKYEKNKHIGLLKVAFSDCAEIQPKLNSAMLSHKWLININKEYHEYVCEDEECIVYETMTRRVKVRFAPIAGISKSKIQFNEGFFSDFSYEQGINPLYGLQMNIIPPIANERISFQVEVLYNKEEIQGSYRGYYDLLIKYSMFSPSVGLRYNYNKGKVRPSFSFGVLNNKLLNPKITSYVGNIPGEPATENSLTPEDINMKTDLWGGYAQIGCNFHVTDRIALFTNIKYSYTSGTENNPLALGPSTAFVKTTLGTTYLSCGIYF